MSWTEAMLPLTEEEIQELEEASKRIPCLDDDCPEMTPEQLKQFHRTNLFLKEKSE